MRILCIFQFEVNSMGRLFSWLLKETKGITILDKCILFTLKIAFLSFRILVRIFLGRKRRDNLFLERQLGFNSFLYNVMRFLRLDRFIVLKISVPKFNYKFYCRTNREDFIFMTGHEDEIIEHFCPKEGDIVVDVGAHIGHYTIIGSKRIGLNGKVIAIEAHPGNFDILNRNIQLNRLTNVIPLNYAVYSQRTKIKLYLPDEDLGYTIYNTIMVNRANPGDNFVEVNADTLDNILQLNRIKQVNWVKIDVEGAELEVLKGATNVLSNSKDISLLLEVHGFENYMPIVDLLKSLNFKIEFEDRSKKPDWRHIIVRKFD
jgi:FkbM family methyltransferase